MAQILAPYEIQSVFSKHPHLPQEIVDTFNLTHSLARNAPITPNLIKEVENTAVALEQIQVLHPLITDAVVQTAKSRATSISQAYSSAEFGAPAPPLAVLMNAIGRLQESMERMEARLERMEARQEGMEARQERMEARQERMEARQDNARIARSNLQALSIDSGTTRYQAKKKEIAGDGTALANRLAPNNANVDRLVALPQPPVVGAVLAHHIETRNLSHQIILEWIQFYNEDFDIVAGDPVATRSQKMRQWMSRKV